MPRRTTRKVSAKPKAKAEVSKDRTSYSEKEEQKQIYLAEFHADVSAALKDIKKSMKSAELALNKKRDLTIASIPSEIRHLTVKEFAALGGTFEQALMSLQKTKLAQSKSNRHMANLLDEVVAFQCDKTSSKDKLKEEVDEKENEVAELKIVQTALRKGQRRRLKSTLRTPAITPKFDPYLPATPENIRGEKPGEKLILMSMAGSPVRIDRRTKIARLDIEDTLKDCGLSPGGIERVFGTLANSIAIE